MICMTVALTHRQTALDSTPSFQPNAFHVKRPKPISGEGSRRKSYKKNEIGQESLTLLK
jgi:hypothetical protein